MWVAGVFLVWSLGPYLTVSANTALVPPGTLLLGSALANARMPGRAFVGVVLAVSLTSAIILASIGDGRRRTRLVALALAVVLVDLGATPPGHGIGDSRALPGAPFLTQRGGRRGAVRDA